MTARDENRSVHGARARALLERVTEQLAREGVTVVRKRDVPLQRWIDRALRVVTFGAMRAYLTDYVTTIGRTIYLPEGWESVAPGRRWETLEHELVHVRQFERYGLVGMAILYLLLPLPMGLAWFRARLEWEAYRVSLRCVAELEGIDAARDPAFREEIVRRFSGPDYGYMWPFAASVRRWIESELDAIERSLAVE
ncbi:MAG: hypothetical protein JNK05_31700 [Myxococcales bacterium]|nr:hypothetical protein [Myxococcales bacterium]